MEVSEVLASADQVTPDAQARQALLVLGMHRSGTSALTRVLSLCGAALPRHNMAAAESNSLGFWEPQRIVDTHDRFLKAAGTGWEAIAGYPATLFTSEAAAACRRTLIGHVAREYGDEPLFILKDPRLSRLMPLWRPVLSQHGIAPRIVIMVRNPLEVASSMKVRDGWGEHRALLVWLRYQLAAEHDTRDLVRCFVGYDQLMADWRGTVHLMSEKLGLALPPRDPAAEREIDAFIRSDLRHHSHQSEALFQRDDVADCVKEAYRCFCEAAGTGSVDHAALDRIAGALDEAEAWLKHMTGSAVPPVRPVELRPRPKAGDTLTAVMLAEIEQANNVVEQSQRLIRELRATWSWRLTKPFRAMGRTVRRLAGK